MVIGGSVVTTVGLVLFYQDQTGSWATWAYAWALVGPAASGLGLLLWGLRSGSSSDVRNGMWALLGGLAIFAVGFLFFEGIIGISGEQFPIADWVLPAVVIAIGVVVLARGLIVARRLRGHVASKRPSRPPRRHRILEGDMPSTEPAQPATPPQTAATGNGGLEGLNLVNAAYLLDLYDDLSCRPIERRPRVARLLRRRARRVRAGGRRGRRRLRPWPSRSDRSRPEALPTGPPRSRAPPLAWRRTWPPASRSRPPPPSGRSTSRRSRPGVAS